MNATIVLNMMKRDLKERYIGTMLGRVWVFFQPLALLLLYTLVFGEILQLRFDEAQSVGNFAFYLMAGLIAFNAFSEALNRSVQVLTQQRDLLLHSPVDPLLLVLVPVLNSAIVELITVFFFVLCLAVFEHSISPYLYLYPLVLLVRIAVSLAGATLLSIFNVFVRDIAQALGLFLSILLFATPILYPLSLVPESFQWFFDINPFRYLVDQYRVVLLGAELDWTGLSILLLGALVVAILGIAVFRALMSRARYVL